MLWMLAFRIIGLVSNSRVTNGYVMLEPTTQKHLQRELDTDMGVASLFHTIVSADRASWSDIAKERMHSIPFKGCGLCEAMDRRFGQQYTMEAAVQSIFPLIDRKAADQTTIPGWMNNHPLAAPWVTLIGTKTRL